MNILVVEDQPVVRELLAAVASSTFKGSRVHSAGNLESALELARGTRMQAVLLDLGLPGCQGIDALRRFKEAFPLVTVVVVSSNQDPRVIAAALDAGASGYVPKGLTPAGLSRALAGAQPAPAAA
jgi:DNA-binding NarL/FixJ family response regulator